MSSGELLDDRLHFVKHKTRLYTPNCQILPELVEQCRKFFWHRGSCCFMSDHKFCKGMKSWH